MHRLQHFPQVYFVFRYKCMYFTYVYILTFTKVLYFSRIVCIRDVIRRTVESAFVETFSTIYCIHRWIVGKNSSNGNNYSIHSILPFFIPTQDGKIFFYTQKFIVASINRYTFASLYEFYNLIQKCGRFQKRHIPHYCFYV